jgi:MFS transporter, Spinster family, sphingosine-1-phosphate transporter
MPLKKCVLIKFFSSPAQYVVVPTRRSTAEAFQILISHAFGDAGSPYLVGVISEAIKRGMRSSLWTSSAENNFGKIEVLSQLAENATTTFGPQVSALLTNDPVEVQFKALQYSLFTTTFVEVLGGAFFLATAFYILKDRANVDRAVAGNGKFDW